MAATNIISRALDALVAALLVALGPDGTGAIKTCERRVLDPTEPNTPCVGLAFDGFSRKGGIGANQIWEVQALLSICCGARERGATAEDAALDLLAEVHGAIETHNNSGTAGGVWDMPRGEVWCEIHGPTVPVGVHTLLRLRTDGVLKITE